eukprot:369986-Rhodomonas_salina.1
MQEHTAASNRNSEVGSKDWEGSSNGRLSCGRESTGARVPGADVECALAATALSTTCQSAEGRQETR